VVNLILATSNKPVVSSERGKGQSKVQVPTPFKGLLDWAIENSDRNGRTSSENGRE
jgi:hypothetical protein